MMKVNLMDAMKYKQRAKRATWVERLAKKNPAFSRELNQVVDEFLAGRLKDHVTGAADLYRFIQDETNGAIPVSTHSFYRFLREKSQAKNSNSTASADISL